MPEGPEVRVISDHYRKILEGLSLIDVTTLSKHGADLIDPSSIPLPLKFFSIFVKGKKLLMLFENEITIVFSFGMEGRLIPNKEKHSHICFDFGNTLFRSEERVVNLRVLSVFFDESRPFVKRLLVLRSKEERETFLAKLGPDLLNEEVSKEKFIAAIRGVSQTWGIHKAITEQEIICGVGNYLKSEILYYACIDPRRILASLSDEELNKIREVGSQIIRFSYQCGGLTIKSFWSPDGKAGRYPPAVYQRDFDPYGNQVIREKLKGKQQTTFWAPAVQH